MTDIRALYHEMIIDHGRHPRNFGQLPGCSHEKEGNNPLCGDKITVYLMIEGDVVKAIKFDGVGCAISMASASLMSQALQGKTVAEITAMFDEFHDLVMGKGDGGHLGKLSILAGVSEYPARVKCATLAWHTLIAAMNHDQQAVSTE